jgi:hypothetical protein
MKQLLIALTALIGMTAASYAAENQAPLAQKLSEQKMTQGLSTDTPSGVPGLVYQGGVAGYSGPARESDKQIGTSLKADPDRQSATQKAVEDLRKAVEQKNGANGQKALRQSQTAIETQFEETTRALQQQQTKSAPQGGGGTSSPQIEPQQGNR